jgi:hypothetical protein
MEGDTLAVGADLYRPADRRLLAGAVYVYERVGDNWVLVERLESDAPEGAMFGVAVALSGDSLAVGATSVLDESWPPGFIGYTWCAPVYIYRRRGGLWSLEQKAEAQPRGELCGSGRWLALSDDRLAMPILHSRLHPDYDPQQAVTLRRERGVWSQSQQLDFGLGTSVSLIQLDGLRAVARVLGNSSLEQVPTYTPPVIYGLEYVKGRWSTRQLVSPDGEIVCSVGPRLKTVWRWGAAPVAIANGVAVVGTGHYADGAGAKVFELVGSRWVQRAALKPDVSTCLAGSVATDGRTIVFGDPGFTSAVGVQWAGIARIYDRAGATTGCVCPAALDAPQADIDAALANPARYAGWGQRRNPGLPPGPSNPLRECLTRRSPSAPYHPVWNSLVWRAGCS